ncbi:MAG: Crp/Fnr family transcriptional regulator [Muribaculaceae bacterium]|nr:Crp/Fnr family transcriptional regulator [Muribaculaceae bacterium]
MTKDNSKMNPIDFSICNEVFEKFGERRLIGQGEYFARSGEVMEYAGWIVSGGFKYSLKSSNGNDKVIGFSLDDSLLIDYESVMHSTKMRTDIIALEDSEVIVIPAKILREKLNLDHELNMNLMMGLFEQLYDQFVEFGSHIPAQRYLQLLDRHPRITDIASYGDIASHLNISRRHLQRIQESQSKNLSKDEIINPSL